MLTVMMNIPLPRYRLYYLILFIHCRGAAARLAADTRQLSLC